MNYNIQSTMSIGRSYNKEHSPDCTRIRRQYVY